VSKTAATRRTPKQRTRRRKPRAAESSQSDRLDAALALTFPASDPPAVGKPTATEPPRRPQDRKPPLFNIEMLDRAANDAEAVPGQAGDPHNCDPAFLVMQHFSQLLVLPWAVTAAWMSALTQWPLAMMRQPQAPPAERGPKRIIT
jgi:hypothetical protein